MTGRFSVNLLADLREILGFPFMVHALLAGTAAAILGGSVGWFMVLRRQTFAGHTLAVVSFPGAAAAGWLGLPLAAGYFGSCVLAALVIGLLPPGVGARGRSEESAVIGTVQALMLAAGFLFVSLYHGFLGGIAALLFGSFLGISAAQVLVVAAVTVGCLLALALVGRPLLFASVDPGVAAARGIPVRPLSVLLLVILGLAAAQISQITGALLVFALLVMPAAAAGQLTARSGLGLVLAVGIGVATVWLSLLIAYYAPYPVGFFTTSVGLVGYLLSVAVRRSRDGRMAVR